ncbi:MAG: GMC oxidoreductase [Planctomyces sp.]
MFTEETDVLVIGSGPGGGVVASTCAARGLSVVVLERGALPPVEGSPAARREHGEGPSLIERQPCDDRTVWCNDVPRQMYVGGRAGGSSGIYGAALLRPQPVDFEPGAAYGARLPSELWRWPIRYDEFEPWLQRAERLCGVAGALQRDFQPCRAADGGGLPSELPLAPINQRVLGRLQRAGHHVWRLPLAIDADRCLRCDQCAGVPCPTGARWSALRVLTTAGQSCRSLILKPRTEAVRLQHAAGRIDGLEVCNRDDGRHYRIRARRYVLAAGAIGTAALLLASGIEHAQLGRNFMYHCSPVVVGLFLSSTGGRRTFIKQLGVSDYYNGTPDLPQKMGIVQSLPAPGPVLLAKNGLRVLPVPLRQWLRDHMLPMVGIVEDLPSPENRVQLSGDGQIHLHHRFSAFDLQRADALTGGISRLLKTAGARLTVAGKMPPAEHVGHQCGTARFGHNRQHAVLDPQCRTWSHPELYVADASFMPTSLGVGPALTVIANALRVGEILCNEL